MKKVKSGSDISFNFNVKVTDKTTVDEIIREASDIIKVRFAEYKVEPEESEDERIRKLLVSLVTIAPTFSALAFTMKDSTDCLSYLEKQKENPKSADSISEDCTSDANSKDRWHKVTDSLPDNGQLVLAKDCLGNVLLARYDGENWEVNVYDNEDHYCHNSISKWCEIPSEKQKEQKPAMIQWTGKNLKEVIDFTGKSRKFGKWFKSWEDYENYVHSHGGIFKLFCEDGSHYEVPVGAWIVKTPDGYNIPSRFRFVQKPAEWSEEDEDIRDTIIHDLKRLGGDIANVKPAYKKEIDWLKSLRPQSHWKPSEEQIEALKDVAYGTYQNGDGPALRSLYDDLKKLGVKEEPEYYQHFDPDC